MFANSGRATNIESGLWAFLPGGEYAVSGGDDQTVRVWNVLTGENFLHLLREHSKTVMVLWRLAQGTLHFQRQRRRNHPNLGWVLGQLR